MKQGLSRRRFIASAAAMLPTVVAAGQSADAALVAMLAGAPASAQAQNSEETKKTNWKDAGVIDLSHSPYARLKTVPVRAVVIGDGFWSQRRKSNLLASIPSMHDELLAHGRMTNFLRLEGKSTEPQKGPVFSDSDIYKWTEAVAFQLQVTNRPELQQ